MEISSAQAAQLLDGLRDALDADGYGLDVSVAGSVIRLDVTARPQACADCLVPKGLMVQMAAELLRPCMPLLEPGQISITYPADGVDR
jgi:hypothetical protein